MNPNSAIEESAPEKPSYYPQSDIIEFVNQRYTERIDRGCRNLGGRTTSSLRKYIARTNLLRQELGFELPAGDQAMVKHIETGEIYFHADYLRFTTENDHIEGLLSPTSPSRRFLTDYVQLRLLDLNQQ